MKGKGIFRILIMVVAMAITIGAAGAVSFADDTMDIITKEVKYLDENGDSKTLPRDDYKIIGVDVLDPDAGEPVLESGWYIAISQGAFLKRIEVQGDVKIIIVNGANIDCKSGIHVPEQSTLSIYGQGVDWDTAGILKATGEKGCAGIGGNWTKSIDAPEKTGTINIYGGRIEATGGEAGAGIGGGCGLTKVIEMTRAGGDGNTINVKYGWVVANGGAHAAGIGGGSRGNSGTINLTGGIVEARGGENGAGIGGGRNLESGAYYQNGGSAENITIDGSSVRAFGGKYAAGVGGGRGANGSTGYGSDRAEDKKWITVKSGSLYAVGGEGGAGIGGGMYPLNDWFENGAGANVRISGGTVTAIGGSEAAGIGSSRAEAEGSGDTVISGGKVTARGGDYAAGIGTGNMPRKMPINATWPKLYNIDISGEADVTATGGKEAAGIGTGNEGIPSSGAHGTLKISGNAKVTATGGKYGAGIGGGDQNTNGETIISGGTVNATGGYGGAGIGSGDDIKDTSYAGKITISGGTVNANGGEYGAGIGGGDTSDMKSEVEIKGGKTTATAGSQAAGIGGGNHTWLSGGGKGGTVKIDLSKDDNDPFVMLTSGQDASPIGHGQGGEDSGSLDLFDAASVKSSSIKSDYKSIVGNAPDLFRDRKESCQYDGIRTALIEVCSHKNAKYTYLDENKHLVRCPSCGKSEEENHDITATEPCSKCNYGGETWTLTLKEGPTGSHISEIKVARGRTATLPSCDEKYIPENTDYGIKTHVFAGWASSSVMERLNGIDLDQPKSDEEIEKVKAALGNIIKPLTEVTPTKDDTYTAIYLKRISVNLVSEEESEKKEFLDPIPYMYSKVKLPVSTSFVSPDSSKTFAGWIDKEDNNKEYAPGAEYEILRNDIVLTVKWAVHEHDFTDGHHEAVAPTCDEYGIIEYWRCNICERCFTDAEGTKEISEGEAYRYPTGHQWDEPTYTWSDDNSKVTASRICLNDTKHVEEETKSTERIETVKPTCKQEGEAYYVVSFDNPDFKLQSKTVKVDKAAHEWGTWEPVEGTDKEKRTCSVCGAEEERDGTHEHTMKHHEATSFCTKQGTRDYYECTECGKLYIDSEGNQEITEDALGTPAIGHKYGTPTTTVIKEATCDEEGVLRVSKPCERCNYVKDEYPNTPALGHDWDGGKVTKEATCEEKGTKEYTCVRDPEHKKTETTAALGHDWGEWEEVTEGGVKYDKRMCSRCDAVQKVAREDTECEHEVIVKEGKPATCLEDGLKEHYECSKCGLYLKKDGEDYIAVGKDELDQYLAELKLKHLGHDWGEPTYTWSKDNSSVVAEHVCTRDADHVEKEEGVITEEIVKEATETEDGEKILTATFKNDDFETQTKTVVIPAKGKDEPTPTPDRSKQKGEDGTAYGKGASIEAAEAALLKLKSEKDPKGTRYAPLMAKSTKQKKTSIKLTWKKAPGAKKYIVYASPCGKTKKVKKLATLGTSRRSYNVKKAAGKKLKKGKYYKFVIIAVDKNNNVVTTSKFVHAATAGSKKAANNKKVVVKAKVTKTGKKLKKYKTTSAIAIKAKKTAVLKVTATKAKKTKVSKHVGIRYESSNTKVATVTSKGKVKGLKKGTAKIYCIAQNGIAKVIKVKVK